MSTTTRKACVAVFLKVCECILIQCPLTRAEAELNSEKSEILHTISSLHYTLDNTHTHTHTHTHTNKHTHTHTHTHTHIQAHTHTDLARRANKDLGEKLVSVGVGYAHLTN